MFTKSYIPLFLCGIHFVSLLSTCITSEVNITADVFEYIRISAKSNGQFPHYSYGTALPVGSFKACNTSSPRLEEKREAIKNAVKHAWDAYVKSAWSFDELSPITQRGKHTFASGLGTTIIDSLSTLYMMGGLDGRYEKAREWVEKSLDFSKVGRVIVFETVIRILGGLISMFHLTGDSLYLRKAEELGARLAPGFDTPSGLPWPRCFLNETGRCETHATNGDSLFLAEVGSIQLEYRALAHHSTFPLMKRMRNVTEGILDHLQRAESNVMRLGGENRALFPFALSLKTGKWNTNLVTLGAPADSYFEYLVKLWVQGGKREPVYWERFAEVMSGLLELGSYKSINGVIIVRDVIPYKDGRIKFQHRMDHFSCYIPGMIVLGIDGLPKNDVDKRARWARMAEELTETCFQMYKRSPSGLAGEYIRLNEQDQWRMSGGYQLRPEAVEAFFYMYRFTKKQKYRDYAWHVFENIERHCRVDEGGYSSIRTARSMHPTKEDTMHSFFISETLKYIYLIFGDSSDEFPLDKWVFNTEAHPFLVTPGMNADSDSSRSNLLEDHDEL